MTLPKKTEVIDFREFLAGSSKSNQSSDITLYSGFLPSMTISSFFDMSPTMSGLYCVVLGVGCFAILSHLIEVNSAKNGFNKLAYIVESITRFILPVGTFSFMIWVLFKIV
ncbi:hypothetical protein [Bacillus weihaiensis]|nr:hypothetical protein [Bacillus weihaiensis]